MFLRLAGLSMVVLSSGHVYLAKLLDWENDLKKLNPINQQVFFAHTMFLTIGIFLLGLVCLIWPHSLINRSELGAIANGCFAMCWLSRLIFQGVVFTAPFSESARLERGMRILGTLLWIYYTALFCAMFAYQIGVIGN